MTFHRQAYGEANLPELEREITETAGRRSEGVTEARMAVYRSARQIPRYRFFGDPPLKEQDEEYFAQRECVFSLLLFFVPLVAVRRLSRLGCLSGEEKSVLDVFAKVAAASSV